jgi:hypothetical protein
LTALLETQKQYFEEEMKKMQHEKEEIIKKLETEYKVRLR